MPKGLPCQSPGVSRDALTQPWVTFAKKQRDADWMSLPQIRPRRPRTPRLNIRPRNQESTSTGSLISSFHLELRSPGSARDAITGFDAGFNGTRVFTFLANGSSDLA